MTRDVLDLISQISSVLGLWTVIGIITFLILCWRRISYVYRLRDSRKEARRQIQIIRDEIGLLMTTYPDIEGRICPILHGSIEDREQRLRTLCRVEDNLRFNISAFFRADPCLRHLEGLKQDLSQKLQRMREAREHHGLIQEAQELIQGGLTLRDAPRNLVSQTDDTSSPPGEGNNIQTCGADAASQPDESWQLEVDEPNESCHHDLSGGHCTGIEIMSTGTGNLRQRGAEVSADETNMRRQRADSRAEVEASEQDGLEMLANLFDWIDGLDRQPTTKAVRLYERFQSITLYGKKYRVPDR